MKSEVPGMSERFKGCLLGGAIGDALGYPIEFLRDGKTLSAGTPLDLKLASGGRAWVSDDTQMTLFCAEGLIRYLQGHPGAGIGGAGPALELAFDRWYATQVGLKEPLREGAGGGSLLQDRRLHARRAPGNTCLSALHELRGGRRSYNDSKGCGAIMRSAPIGLSASSPAQAFALAAESGRATHHHVTGYLSAAAFAALIHSLARGASLASAIPDVLQQLAAEKGHEETSRALTAALGASAEPLDRARMEALGEGWTGEEALALGVRAALHADHDPTRVAEALWCSVAHHGDSDSTGSIAGNLLGARHGLAGLPTRWCEQVELRDLIERLAHDLHAAMRGEPLDPTAYPPA